MSAEKRLTLLMLMLVASLVWPASPAAAAGGTKWYNPLTWSAPTMPWSKEPPRIKRKSQGVVADLNRTAQSGWHKTKSAMNPTKLFRTSSEPARDTDQPGFWTRMFGPTETAGEIRTVDDFLNQPRIQ